MLGSGSSFFLSQMNRSEADRLSFDLKEKEKEISFFAERIMQQHSLLFTFFSEQNESLMCRALYLFLVSTRQQQQRLN